MKQQLYLIRGIPGQGKSTFASKLHALLGSKAKWFEQDQWRGPPGPNRVYKKELNPVAWAWCQGLTAQALWDKYDVIVSNTFTTLEGLKPYFLIAADLRLKGHDIEITVMHVQGPIGRSIHKTVTYERYVNEWQEYKGEFDSI